MPVRELSELLIATGNENIEQTSLCVKGKDTTTYCVLSEIEINPDRVGFPGAKKNYRERYIDILPANRRMKFAAAGQRLAKQSNEKHAGKHQDCAKSAVTQISFF